MSIDRVPFEQVLADLRRDLAHVSATVEPGDMGGERVILVVARDHRAWKSVKHLEARHGWRIVPRRLTREEWDAEAAARREAEEARRAEPPPDGRGSLLVAAYLASGLRPRVSGRTPLVAARDRRWPR